MIASHSWGAMDDPHRQVVNGRACGSPRRAMTVAEIDHVAIVEQPRLPVAQPTHGVECGERG